MKLLLVALNAKYIHSNLAVYSLKSYAKEYENNIEIAEFTINHSEEEVLKELYLRKADLIAFSCYIWNIGMVTRLMGQIKKVMPSVKIWLGGPEVSYDAENFIKRYHVADGIIIGEGEQTFLELVKYYVEESGSLDDIAGLVFRASARRRSEHKPDDMSIFSTDERQLLSLDRLPFPYEDMMDEKGVFNYRIIYYESSRGCPYSCSYCLSSIDKRLRFRDLEQVKKELMLFIDNKVEQVKFVDRTFNCNKNHAMEIWKFIKEHDNGITNFHFEISADLFDEDELEFLRSLRPGQVQFEIGVQTINPDTIKAIHRRMDLDKLSKNVRILREANNIHLHLDLIAGLPYEDYASFEKSFNYVYALRPHQLQLGFLKVLKGSCMEKDSVRYGIVYRDEPPYEVLYTECLPFEDMLKLKGICEMIEVYYNSGQFANSIMFLEHFFLKEFSDSKMKLYEALFRYYERNQLDKVKHSRIKRYEILLDFFKELVLESYMSDNITELTDLFKELLIYDLCLRENLKSRPAFYTDQVDKEELKKLYAKYRNKRNNIHIELFRFHINYAVLTGNIKLKKLAVIFDYDKRDPINNSAEVEIIEY